MVVSGSTLARRALGRELRRLRTTRGIHQAEAARIAETSPQSISRIEEGQSTRVTSFQINALCDAYGASDDERKVLLGLQQEVRSARERGGGWWRAYADAQMPTDFDHYLALEESAHRLTAWKTGVVPGLLQTPDYRRALAWSEIPPLSPEAVESRIEVATRRQTRLDDSDFQMDVLLSEAVLRDRVGGPAVMARQLRHLVRLSDITNVSIQVVPFTARHHLGVLVGSFILLEFPVLPQSKLTEPPIVYVEEYAGDLYLERDSEVRRYRDALRELRQVALTKAQSGQLIRDAAREHERDC
ncbi:helix-turn-helix domain-containing protein [Nocardia otitidiscaviarum]|uniref:helix-turn-helix domain-containing protein n=1 Tax=Nocardia otitidiscaviarum TaxID=1823 RepID=UPI001893B62D|nr:helix-turn-helix transcriptional regulator [Nocardia otitidiscaviarum]MBF6136944.1 helix-turn-helix domain-containing protein [Nocardia otitidiscaviarum]